MIKKITNIPLWPPHFYLCPYSVPVSPAGLVVLVGMMFFFKGAVLGLSSGASILFGAGLVPPGIDELPHKELLAQCTPRVPRVAAVGGRPVALHHRAALYRIDLDRGRKGRRKR